MDLDYVRAEDLEHAWLNFELDLPLSPQKNGDPNPFYVKRPGNPVSRLERELLLPYRQPPKYFFQATAAAVNPPSCANWRPAQPSNKNTGR